MDIDLGPLSVIICWQSILLSLVVATATHGVKKAIDFNTNGGKEARQHKIFINRIVLPSTPIIFGILAAIFIPMHPEALIQYIKDHALTGRRELAVLAAYGACLGQFSDYVWHRFSGIMDDVKKRKSGQLPPSGGPPPPPAPPPPAELPPPPVAG